MGRTNQPEQPVLTGGCRVSGPQRERISGVPVISIVIVVRNGASTIRDAIGSVIDQGWPNVELIVVDGCSTDGTLDILAGYGTAIDLWISEPDEGIYDAMNKAVRLTTGDWVLFLGCDDTVRMSLAKAAERLVNPAHIYYGNVWMRGRNVVYDGEFGPWKLLKRNICHQAIFYPRSVFDHHQFETDYSVVADWVFNLRCYRDSAYSFSFMREIVAEYNATTGHSARNRDAAFEADQSRIVRETLPLPVYFWHLLKTPVRSLRSRCQ